MKKKICALILMVITSMAFCMSVNAESYKVTNSTGVTVRASATSKSQRLGGLSTGRIVDVKGTKNGWLMIDYKGKTGYIYSKYATKVSSNNNGGSSNNAGKTLKVTQSCNVRSAAGQNNEYLGRANYGKTYNVLGEGKAPNGRLWYKISYNGSTGWVCSSFVKITNSGSNTPNKPSNPSNTGSGNLVCIGNYTLTAYCNCKICCGKWAGGPTYSGVMPKEGRTIAVDKNKIPLGTKVVINGHEYIAEDTGSAIKNNKIDIYFTKHSDANKFGVKYNVPVYIYK